jgi:hypothetical protein
MQAGFDAWRTGEAFKEAHGGGGMSDFFKLLGTALFILDGAPKPAFYAGDSPLTATSAKDSTHCQAKSNSLLQCYL